ncbi:unnamed protein product [Pedinophyceae sp. YPF-701]|nr:unnamed protein product [Pedinophyceae sp. YPF-701]
MATPADLMKLEPQQLESIAETLEKDIERFGEFFAQLSGAAGTFASSQQAVLALKDEKPGKPMLVPVTSSMYVRGTLADTSNVLVDIGTGYFAEKDVNAAADFCARKVKMLRGEAEKVQAVVQAKQQQHMQISQIAQMKQQQAAKAAGSS